MPHSQRKMPLRTISLRLITNSEPAEKITPPPDPMGGLKIPDKETEGEFLNKLRDINALLLSCIEDVNTFTFKGSTLKVAHDIVYPDEGKDFGNHLHLHACRSL
jgi:hypothetical protein